MTAGGVVDAQEHTEQRTQPQGHFSYRRVAWGMFEALRGRYPSLAAPIRAVDPRGPQDLLKR